MKAPKTSKIAEQTTAIVQQAAAIEVATNDGYVAAGEFVKRCRAALKTIDDTFDPIIKKQNESIKTARDQKKKLAEPIQSAAATVERRMIEFRAAQEAERIAEQRRLAEQARKDQEAAAIASAIEAEAAGDRASADEILSAPVAPPVVVLRKTTPKIEGQSFRKIWKFKVTNPAAIPREYLMVDEVKLGQYARMAKATAQMPGVHFYSEDSMASTGF